MSKPAVRKLPPLSAVEFAVEHAFRRYLFGLMLVSGWLVVLAPVAGAVWYLVGREGIPAPEGLKPVQIAALGVLGVALLLALLSIGVNWSRRLLRDERPHGLGWFRLDASVWKSLAGTIVVVIITGLLAGLAALAAIAGPKVIEPMLASAAKPAAAGCAAVIGLAALFTFLRLVARLPGIAVGNRDFGFTAAWRASRRNSLRYLGFLFWLVFAMAIAAAIAGGAIHVRQLAPYPWAEAFAIAVAALAGLWLLLFVMSLPVGLYRFFGEQQDFPGPT